MSLSRAALSQRIKDFANAYYVLGTLLGVSLTPWELSGPLEDSGLGLGSVTSPAFTDLFVEDVQLFLLTVSIFLGLGQPRNPKGKRKGPGRPGTLASGPHQVPLDLVSQAKPYARMEEYERNLGEMVAQLRNSSEPARRKCEVNLQLWLSNKRSLSPWGYSINHDPSRIPADLPEARCLCLGCVNPFTMQEDRSMVSVPVFSQVPVRRRLCPLPPRTGPCRQRAVMETIAVGCTCIF
ncbi:interleukin-17B [Lynx rufus]|uniref:interleukin-17B n=1 Tax=Lynx rufus TaxID=61384 RepID=UPI001F127F9E|nr:interleukin-17B [Lynx rufus]